MKVTVLVAGLAYLSAAEELVRPGHEVTVKERVANSVTGGRHGLHRCKNVDHSIEMGKYAALKISAEASVKSHFNWDANTWSDGRS